MECRGSSVPMFSMDGATFKTPLEAKKVMPRVMETPKTPELSFTFENLHCTDGSDSVKMKLSFDGADNFKQTLQDSGSDKKIQNARSIHTPPVINYNFVSHCKNSGSENLDVKKELLVKTDTHYNGVVSESAWPQVFVCTSQENVSREQISPPTATNLSRGVQEVEMKRPAGVSDHFCTPQNAIISVAPQVNFPSSSSSSLSIIKSCSSRFQHPDVPSKPIGMLKPSLETRSKAGAKLNREAAWANIRMMMHKSSLPRVSTDEDEEEKKDTSKPQSSNTSCQEPAHTNDPNRKIMPFSSQSDLIPRKPLPKRTPLSTVSQQRVDTNSIRKANVVLPTSNPLCGSENSNQKLQLEGQHSACSEELLRGRGSASVVDNKDVPRHTLLRPTNNENSTTFLERMVVNNKAYLIVSLLGRGGSSKVYQAVAENCKTLAAIKVVDLNDVDLTSQQAYHKEVGFLIKLKDCQWVINMLDYEYKEEEKILYIVMEKGDSDMVKILRELSTGKESLADWQRKIYWSQMLKAVQEIHNKGIIHSDLKPANFIMANGKLKLIDFGIASTIHSDMTSVIKDTQVGTINYMSPESLFASTSHTDARVIKVRPKSDVWSLGCILYNLTYGQTPFQSIKNTLAKMQAICNPNYKIPFPLCNDVFLLDVLKKCLERDPGKRPSIEELLAHPYLTLPSGNVQSLMDSLKAACSPNSLMKLSNTLQFAKHEM